MSMDDFAKHIKTIHKGTIRCKLLVVRKHKDCTDMEAGTEYFLARPVEAPFRTKKPMALDGDAGCVYPAGVYMVKCRWYEHTKTLENGDRLYRLAPKTKRATKLFALHQFIRVGSAISFAETGVIGGSYLYKLSRRTHENIIKYADTLEHT